MSQGAAVVAQDAEELRRYRSFVLGRWMRFTIGRLAAALLAVVVLLVVVFFIVRLIPGDPARRIAGADATPEYVRQIRHELGLDDSLWQQFVGFVGRALHLDFGSSFVSGQAVNDLVAERLPLTLDLAVSGLLVACVLGTAMGIGAAALTRNGRRPRFETFFVYVSGGLGVLPELAAGTALVALFSVWLRVTPVSGVQGLDSLVLPALAIGLRPAFNLARVVRVELLDALDQQYMQTAASKRLHPVRQYLAHAVPNAMTAVLTLFGLLFAHIVGGVVVVESLFAWPGIGSALVQAVLDRDYPVVQALVALVGLTVIVTNLVVDEAIGLLDRQRVLGGGRL